MIPKPYPSLAPCPELLGCVTSTNEVLAGRLKGNRGSLIPYTSIVAHHQRAGRGRLGRTWSSAPGSSLLMSITIPVTDDSLLSWIPLYAGFKVQQMIQAELPTKASIELKWPNDVLLDHKKVAGILCEYHGYHNKNHWIIVGVGINLSQRSTDFATLPATSLHLHGWDQELGPQQQVPSPTILRLAWTLTKSMSAGPPAPQIVEDYLQNCSTIGQRVQALLPDNTIIDGIANGLSASGGLLVRTKDNSVHAVNAGDVTLSAERPRLQKIAGEEIPQTVCEECR